VVERELGAIALCASAYHSVDSSGSSGREVDHDVMPLILARFSDRRRRRHGRHLA
jgi:hypothetical protein